MQFHRSTRFSESAVFTHTLEVSRYLVEHLLVGSIKVAVDHRFLVISKNQIPKRLTSLFFSTFYYPRHYLPSSFAQSNLNPAFVGFVVNKTPQFIISKISPFWYDNKVSTTFGKLKAFFSLPQHALVRYPEDSTHTTRRAFLLVFLDGLLFFFFTQTLGLYGAAIAAILAFVIGLPAPFVPFLTKFVEAQ